MSIRKKGLSELDGKPSRSQREPRLSPPAEKQRAQTAQKLGRIKHQTLDNQPSADAYHSTASIDSPNLATQICKMCPEGEGGGGAPHFLVSFAAKALEAKRPHSKFKIRKWREAPAHKPGKSACQSRTSPTRLPQAQTSPAIRSSTLALVPADFTLQGRRLAHIYLKKLQACCAIGRSSKTSLLDVDTELKRGISFTLHLMVDTHPYKLRDTSAERFYR